MPVFILVTWWAPYIGLPFSECNCWGLVRRVYADQLGVDLHPFAEIDPDQLRRVALTMQSGAADWLPVDDPQPFDVAVMTRHRLPIHVGIITKPGWLLHTEKATDAVHVPVNHFSVAGRIREFRRWPK